jgi:hypothetical protein
MKKFLLSILIAFGLHHNTMSQSCTSTITAGGPTRFCSGGSVELTAMPAGAWTQKAQFGEEIVTWQRVSV